MAASENHEIRRAAVLALGMVGRADALPVVGGRLRDPDRCVRLIAEMAFGDLLKRQMGSAAAMSLNRARRHLEGHRYRKAHGLLSELTRALPGFAEAWHLLAVVSFYGGQYGGAVKYARCAVDITPHHFAACTIEARCWLELDRPARALKRFEQSFAINPSQTNVQGYIEVLKRKARRINSDDSTS